MPSTLVAHAYRRYILVLVPFPPFVLNNKYANSTQFNEIHLYAVFVLCVKQFAFSRVCYLQFVFEVLAFTLCQSNKKKTEFGSSKYSQNAR